NGTVPVTFAATGGSGAGYSYKVYLDAKNIYTGASSTFTWDTTTAGNSYYALKVVVTDSAGATASAGLHVLISNTLPPTSSPTPGSLAISSSPPRRSSDLNGTVPVTFAATGGSGAGYSYKVYLDAKNIYT